MGRTTQRPDVSMPAAKKKSHCYVRIALEDQGVIGLGQSRCIGGVYPSLKLSPSTYATGDADLCRSPYKLRVHKHMPGVVHAKRCLPEVV